MGKVTLKRTCPVCGNDKGIIIDTIKMDIPVSFRLTKEYNIVSCEMCGSCFADTSSSAEDYNDYYNNHNYYGGGWSCNSSTKFDHITIVRILDKLFDKSVSISDIGCGNGKLLQFLKENGYHNIVGIDPSLDAINELKNFSVKGVLGSVYNKPDKNFKKTKIAIMTMVLEHLLEPDKAIKNISENYIENGGYIIVSWPHFEDLILDNSPILNNFNHEHINYFSVKNADWLFGKFGFIRVEKHISIGTNHNENLTFSNVLLYMKNQNTDGTKIKDIKTADSINEYIHRVKKRELNFIKSIDELSQSGEKIIVWGTGAYMMHLMADSSLGKCNISCFVDNNKLRGGSLYGKKVYTSEVIKNFKGTIVVTAMLYGKDIEKQIRDMGNNECKILII